MDLKQLKANWETFGETDPLWAILTVDGKRGGGWDRDEFFETGTAEIAVIMAQLATLPVQLRRRRALDFGCGVGRLTQALCEHFETCDGVDIADSMVDLARVYNRFGDRCRYHVNTVKDLSMFEDASFDFVYSRIVLQHMRPEYAMAYVREFVRVLAGGGVAAFQVPSHLRQYAEPVARPSHRPVAFAKRTLRRLLRRGAVMEMHGVSKTEVVNGVEQAGGTVLAVFDDAAPDTGWQSYVYYVTRREALPIADATR